MYKHLNISETRFQRGKITATTDLRNVNLLIIRAKGKSMSNGNQFKKKLSKRSSSPH